MEVIVYSTKTCHYCDDVKGFLKENNIDFTCADVSSDLKAREEMFALSGKMGVPQIKIGNDIVLGFDLERIKELLKL